MRFDDRLATLLAQRHGGPEARLALWRQLVDLLAQGKLSDAHQLEDEALRTIEELRSTIPPRIKAETARTFAGRPVSVAVIALFAEEPAPVLGPLISAARLDSAQWLSLLPTLTPTARALLRHRRDLSRDVERALDSFGHSDFVIEDSSPADVQVAAETYEMPAPAPAPLPPEAAAAPIFAQPMEPAPDEPPAPLLDDAPPMAEMDGEAQIRELMARIEAYRAHDFIRPATPAPIDDAAPLESEQAGRFRFETGPDGVINWVSTPIRGPLIGRSIAVPSHGQDGGVDGQVAGAFRQRAPFRDARMMVGGESLHSGEWRISAVPIFDQVNGRFCGFRGTARRPRMDEIAGPPHGAGLFGSVDTVDSLRQLVHELRTPLNAIIGFSEMIEGQYLGPASTRYREKAADISVQGRRLLKALEDLDQTTRPESHSDDDAPIDPVRLIERLHDEFQQLAEQREFHLNFRVMTSLGAVAADPASVERMMGRLLSATLAVAQPGETINVELDHDPETRNRMMLTIARPILLLGRDEQTLLDPGYNPDGDMPDAPVLGLGFALRLVRNIAVACGGTLDMPADKLILRLPLRRVAARRGNA